MSNTSPSYNPRRHESRGVPPGQLKEHAASIQVSPSRAILIVDDEPGVAALLTEVVSNDNCTVDSAGDGEQALVRLQRRDYDLILCDIRMPRMNGVMFYRAIQQWKPQLLYRLVFITGDLLTAETQAFLTETNAPILQKPFNLDDIYAIVRSFLAERAGPEAPAPLV